MKKVERYDWVIYKAETTEGMSNKEIARFHYHNPNGLNFKVASQRERVLAVIKAGKANSGALLVYGCLSELLYCTMVKNAQSKRVGTISLRVWEDMVRGGISDTEEFLAPFET